MSKRFVTHNAHALVQHLRDTGLDPDATTKAPSLALNNGCSDPMHCCTHSGRHFESGERMLSVNTTLSATALHRLAKSMGLDINY